MSLPFEILEAEVMDLGKEERERILTQLLVSKNNADEIETSWVQEALRREAAVAEGRSFLVPGEAALARIRARLA